jgi:hypothetical protein
MLLDKYPGQVQVSDQEGMAPLYLACQFRWDKSVACLCVTDNTKIIKSSALCIRILLSIK